MKQRYRAYVDLAAAMALTGGLVVVSKVAVASFPVFLIGGLRFALATAILLPLVWRVERGLPRTGLREMWLLFLQCFTGIFLFNVLLLYGLRLTTATSGAILTSTTPVVLAVLAVLALRERLTGPTLGAVALAALGIMALNLAAAEGSTGYGPGPLVGNLLVLGAVLGEALYSIFGKAVVGRVSPLVVSCWLSVLGLAMFLPPAIYEALSFDFGAVRASEWLLIVYLAVGATVLGYWLWMRGLAVVPASQAAVFTAVLPVTAVLLSVLWLGERFLPAQALGLVCVLLAIGLVARGREQVREEAQVEDETRIEEPPALVEAEAAGDPEPEDAAEDSEKRGETPWLCG